MSKDIVLKAAIDSQIVVRDWTLRRVERMRTSDRGASMVEYAGLVIIIAAIIGLVKGLNLDDKISKGIGQAVDKVLGGAG